MTYRRTFNEKRYHVTKGFPEDVIKLLDKATKNSYIMKLQYTRHALDQAVLYGCYKNLPDKIDWGKCYIFEVAVVKGILDKVVLRTSFNNTHDIILAVNAANPRVRTLWINEKNDGRNQRIDLSLYDQP